MKGISFFGNTDMGCVRKNNEDTFVVRNIWDDGHLLAVVVDGVGGYEGGEVAAAIARDTIVEYLGKYPNGERLELLKQAVISANDKVLEGKSKSEELSGMSCVLTAILVEVADLRVNMVHVGDTRLYQYAYGKLRKLSHDQSVVGYLEDNGLISEEEAMLHPQRNVISHYVGSEEFKEEGDEYVETSSFPLVPTSTLMLCSDGLSDLVPSDRISSVLSMTVSPEEKVNILIDTPRFTTIPFDLFEDESSETLFYHNFSKIDNEIVLCNVLGKSNIALLFGMDKYAHQLLIEQFPKARIFASISPIIEHFVLKSKNVN